MGKNEKENTRSATHIQPVLATVHSALHHELTSCLVHQILPACSVPGDTGSAASSRKTSRERTVCLRLEIDFFLLRNLAARSVNFISFLIPTLHVS